MSTADNSFFIPVGRRLLPLLLTEIKFMNIIKILIKRRIKWKIIF